MDKTTAAVSLHERDKNGKWMQKVKEDCVVIIDKVETLNVTEILS